MPNPDEVADRRRTSPYRSTVRARLRFSPFPEAQTILARVLLPRGRSFAGRGASEGGGDGPSGGPSRARTSRRRRGPDGRPPRRAWPRPGPPPSAAGAAALRRPPPASSSASSALDSTHPARRRPGLGLFYRHAFFLPPGLHFMMLRRLWHWVKLLHADTEPFLMFFHAPGPARRAPGPRPVSLAPGRRGPRTDGRSAGSGRGRRRVRRGARGRTRGRGEGVGGRGAWGSETRVGGGGDDAGDGEQKEMTGRPGPR